MAACPYNRLMNAARSLLVLALAGSACGARSGLDGAEPTAAGGAGSPQLPAIRLNCPESSADPRLPRVAPEGATELDASAFVDGNVRSYRWSVQEEDCDAVVPRAGYLLEDASSKVVRFRPARPGPYRLALEVVGPNNEKGRCEFPLSVSGRGLRVELCWDTSTTTDLDLYVHAPFNEAPWFDPAASEITSGMTNDTCNTANCTPVLRFGLQRASWGYPDSPLEACAAGPNGDAFRAQGRCPNPRASDDNNQNISSGTTERIQLDNPRRGERFTVMVQNFSNSAAAPHVFVYCGAQRVAALTAPAQPARFRVPDPGRFGVMWRAAHVYPELNAAGETSTCRVTETALGLTVDNPAF